VLSVWALSRGKVTKSPDILSKARNSCCELLLHWFWLSLDNYQTGVDQFCLTNWYQQGLWLSVGDVRKDFVAVFLSVAAAGCSHLLCGLLGKYLLVSKLHNAHIVRQVFLRLQFSAVESWMTVWVLHGSLFTQFLRITISLRQISQGRVAMRLRSGEIFNYHFIANLSQSLTMKEFWKSVMIW